MMLLIGKKQKLNNRSFTLLELLLVIIIVTVLSLLSLPIFKNSFSNLQLSNTSYNLVRLMRYAQERSIVERINYQLNFDSQLAKYWLTKQPDPLHPALYSRISGKTGKAIILPQQVKVETKNYLINFYPDGKIDKTTIYLSRPKQKYFTITTQGQSGYVELFDYKKE